MMLFEKTIRKKRISPFFLELISYLIKAWIISAFLFLLLLAFVYFYLVDDRDFIPILFVVLAMMMISMPLLLIGLNFNAVKQGIYSRGKNAVVLSTKDHMMIDYWVKDFLDDASYPDHTYLYIFLTEPYIYKIAFLTLPENQNIVPAKEFKFYAPPHWSYWFRKDYQRYKDEYMASGYKSISEKLSYNPGNIKYAKKYGGKDYHIYYLYMTYEKAQVFNRLFELVKPPKFRLIYNKKGNILLELQPITGHEYPPEALECMEKINAMYP